MSFIQDAMAQGAESATSGGLINFLFPIVLFAGFYFLLIRPQMKRAKEHKNMVTALGVNDEIVTTGGLLGRVIDLGTDFVTVEIADGVRVRVQKHAVASVMPKGTIKTI